MINYNKAINGLSFVEDVFDESGDKKFSILFDNNCDLIPLANKYLKNYRTAQTNSFCTINRIARDLSTFYDFMYIAKISILQINLEMLKEFVIYLKKLKVRAMDANDKEFIKNRYSIQKSLLEHSILIRSDKKKGKKVINLREKCGLGHKSIFRIFERAILYLRDLYKNNNYNNIEVEEYFKNEKDIRTYLKSQDIEVFKHEINPVDDDMMFTEEEIVQINKMANVAYERLLYFILDKTGVRIGEGLGLKIISYDRENLRGITGDLLFKKDRWEITIYWRPENPFFCRTKSHQTRSIRLKENEIEAFEMLLERYLRWRSKNVKCTSKEWLFISSRGNHLTQNVAYSQFKRTLKKGFLEHRMDALTLHTYRHTMVSRECKKNVPIQVTSKLIGHKRVKTTQATYTHFTKNDINEIRENIDKKLERDFNGK